MFSARRKPKRIAREDPQAEEDHDDAGPVVRRPGAAKTKSKLRVSFNPSEADSEDHSDLPPEPNIKPPPSRLAPSSALQDRLRETSLREDDPSRPSYSKSYLDELRNSTPSTPQAISTPPDEDEQRILDIESKFGKPSLASNATQIPTAAEIAEKKARRARLALTSNNNISNPNTETEDFIPLEHYDSDGEFKPQRMQTQLSTYLQPETTTDSRLEREDEDIAEGFESFIEDNASAVRGRYETSSLQIGRKAKREFQRKQKEEMRNLIEQAESNSDENNSNSEDNEDENGEGEEDSDSDRERQRTYNSTQTHRGLDGLSSHTQHKILERRPRQPPHTTPIIKLSAGLAELKAQVDRLAVERKMVEKRLVDLRREREEVRERGRMVQRELDALGGAGGGDAALVAEEDGQGQETQPQA